MICVKAGALLALLAVKADTGRVVIYASVIGLILIFAGERLFLRAS
jgi:hypothetical protein